MAAKSYFSYSFRLSFFLGPVHFPSQFYTRQTGITATQIDVETTASKTTICIRRKRSTYLQVLRVRVKTRIMNSCLISQECQSRCYENSLCFDLFKLEPRIGRYFPHQHSFINWSHNRIRQIQEWANSRFASLRVVFLLLKGKIHFTKESEFRHFFFFQSRHGLLQLCQVENPENNKTLPLPRFCSKQAGWLACQTSSKLRWADFFFFLFFSLLP